MVHHGPLGRNATRNVRGQNAGWLVYGAAWRIGARKFLATSQHTKLCTFTMCNHMPLESYYIILYIYILIYYLYCIYHHILCIYTYPHIYHIGFCFDWLLYFDDFFTALARHVEKLLIDPTGFNPSRRMRISLESAPEGWPAVVGMGEKHTEKREEWRFNLWKVVKKWWFKLKNSDVTHEKCWFNSKMWI
jgi:hypothetical protein